MTTIGATEARANFADLLRTASVDKQAIVIERRGKATAAVVPIEDLELIEDRHRRVRLSEARFESFAEAASDWFWEMDENCRFTYFSDRFTEVTGVPNEALLGRTREETGIPGVDPEDWRRHLADLAAHRSFRDFRHTRQHPDRGTVHLSISGKAIFDEVGRFRGYRGAGSDITERVQAEEALRKSELRHRHIFEDTVVSTSMVGPIAGETDGRFLRVNAAFCKLLGYSERELLGMTLKEVTHPEDFESTFGNRARILAGEADNFELEKRYVHKSGRIVWAKLSVTAVRDEAGRYVHDIGQHQDITELKRTEEALKRSETKLREILEDSPIGVGIVTHATDETRLTGNRLFINKALVKMFGGASVSEVVGSDIAASWVDLDRLRAAEEIMKSRAELIDFEAKRRRLDGTEWWVSMNARPIRFDDQDCTIVWHFDITDRKRTGDALRASEEQLRLVTDNLPVLISYVDSNLRYRFVNKTAEAWHGRPAGDLIGRHVKEVVRKSAYEKLLARIEAAASGKYLHFEDAIEYSDGQVRAVELTYVPDIAENGQVRGLIGMVVDITERKRAEKRLRESEERFRDFAESSADWFWETDSDLRFVFVSGNVKRIIGRPPEWHYGKTREDLLGDDYDRESWDRHLQSLRDREAFRDFIYCRFGESTDAKWIRTSGLPVFREDGTFAGYRGCASDVTGTVAAQQALAASEEQLRLVTDALPVLIGIVDGDERLVFANNTFEEWIARPRADFIGETIAEIHPHRESYAALRPHIQTALSGNRVTFETTITYGDGKDREVLALFVPRFGADGSLDGFYALVEDVTERRSMQAQLQQSQKMEAVGQLTGGIAHDFNNLLAVITGNLELIAEDVGEGAASRDLAARALAAADRGGALTQRLLAFSRRQALQPRVIDLNGLVAGMNDLLRRTLGETIEIKTVAAGDLWACEADPGQVESALLNLAINARDAMPDGGKLTIETGNVTLDDAYAAGHAEVAAGPYVSVTVTDTGIGMSKDLAAQAFEPFFTTKDVAKGSGLGLSMVYGFAKQSGGDVSIYSEPGVGTAVRIYLPKAAPDDAGVVDKPRPARADLAKGEHVLVVEDDPQVRMLAVAMLESLGYSVLAAENAKAALARLRDGPGIDLLLTDVVLPGGMSGRDLADHAQRHRPGFKVVYMSGYSERAIVHQGRLDDGVHLLQKPFRKAELARTLRAVLDRADT